MQLGRRSSFSRGGERQVEFGAPELRQRLTAERGWPVLRLSELEWAEASSAGGNAVQRYLLGKIRGLQPPQAGQGIAG